MKISTNEQLENDANIKSAIVSPRQRPVVLQGWTFQMQTGCGSLFVTINEDETGLFELFNTMGKAGGCAGSQCQAIGRLISLAWRSGISAQQVIKQLQGISCHSPYGFGENRVLSCADAVAKAIRLHMTANGNETIAENIIPNKRTCPECGGIVSLEKCPVCLSCGYSKCA